MPEIPECLNNRYKALDELIRELSKMNLRTRDDDDLNTDDPGIRLMCDFWKILKEDPDCNLSQAVKQRMGVTESTVYKRQRVTCYMSGRDSGNEEKKAEAIKKIHSLCCKSASEDKKDDKCCASTKSPTAGSDVLPLSKVLCNLKEAASFDKKCNVRINELMKTQKELQDQIQHLEHREKEGVQLLKQADCMWACMEDAYKKKLNESLERQNDLLKQLKEVEKSNAKWRKNRKDLEAQVDNITKCHREILDKVTQKTNDIKCIDLEITDFNKRIENHKKETEAVKKTLANKKQATDSKIANIATGVTKLNKNLSEQSTIKYNKEQEGARYVKEARDDLQNICRLLLQKKLVNEDLTAEKEALDQEIELLKQTCAQCQDKCKAKQISIAEEIKKTDKEIADFKVKCIKCHQCTDTVDARKYCNDCPRCISERDCITKEDLDENKGYCERDPDMDCVCMTVKRELLDNVFENMNTVLERQAKTKSGKAVASAIMGCLKNSRNGKLNEETRRIVQQFILDSVKKNLDLTIVGGAVKTRCEMDPETYKQLMLCLKQVKAVKAPKVDKGTSAKKESCGRWGGCNECNCPGGPKACVCAKKAPPPAAEPPACPPALAKDAHSGEVLACPHKQSKPCGPDCANREPSLVGAEVSWKPDPCAESSCPFAKNMRAAQCVLGPEPLNGSRNCIPVKLAPDNLNVKPCKCKKSQTKPCTCRMDRSSHPRERIIQEVMGKYDEVMPIEKVKSTAHYIREYGKGGNTNKGCICDKVDSKNTPEDDNSLSLEPSSDFLLLEGTDALLAMLHKTLVNKRSKNKSNKTAIKLLSNTRSKMYKNDTDTELNFILPPRFTNNKNISKEATKIGLAPKFKSYCEEKPVLDKSLASKYGERNVSDGIKKVVKAVNGSDNNEETNNVPGFQMITLESLINILSLKAKTRASYINNTSRDEKERVDKLQFLTSLYKEDNIKSEHYSKVSDKTSHNNLISDSVDLLLEYVSLSSSTELKSSIANKPQKNSMWKHDNVL